MKHNGDINIESIEKGTKKRVYNRLIIPGTTSPAINATTTNTNSQSHPNDGNALNDSGTTSALPPEVQPMAAIYPSNTYQERPIPSQATTSSPAPSQQNQLIQLLNQKPKQYQCDLCPYMSSCKAQLECHSLVHASVTPTSTIDLTTKNGATQSAAPKHEPINTMRSPIEDNGKAMDLRTILSTPILNTRQSLPLAPPPPAPIVIDDKVLLFCKYCPARFVSDTEMTTHLKMHASWYPYRCSACTFTSRQELCIEKHANVHTTAYVERSQEFLRSGDYRAHNDYPQPELASVKIDDSREELIWIASEFRKRVSTVTTVPPTQMKPNAAEPVACSSSSVDSMSKEMDLDDIISASKVPNKSYSGSSTVEQMPAATSLSPDVLIVELPIVQQHQQHKTTDTIQIDEEEEEEICRISAAEPPPTEKTKTTIEKQMANIEELRRSTTVASSNPTIQVREEKCPHCPFSTAKPDVLKEHMQYHICVSGAENQVNCDHCDYSVPSEHVLKEHVQLHFMSPVVRKPVNYFTCYDSLVLTSSCGGTSAENINASGNMDGDERKTIFPAPSAATATTMEAVANSSDKENRIIIDINTGEVFK